MKYIYTIQIINERYFSCVGSIHYYSLKSLSVFNSYYS